MGSEGARNFTSHAAYLAASHSHAGHGQFTQRGDRGRDCAACDCRQPNTRLSGFSRSSWCTALPWPLAVIDFEASSLDQDGYAVGIESITVQDFNR
jgi:hypothetical protein